MTEAPSLPTPDPNSIPEQSQIQPQPGTPTGSPPPVDVPPAPIAVPNDDNSEPPSPTETNEPVPEAKSVAPPVGDSSDADIPTETKKWVDKQRPNKKSGDAIINLAKNRNRKDIADIERYVALLVELETLPMSGKTSPASETQNAKSDSSPASPLPLPGVRMEAVEVPVANIRRNAQIRVAEFDEGNVQRIMENFDSTDPVHLFDRPEGELELVDGYNRFEAARRLGRTTIWAFIHRGTLFTGLIFGYKINDRHGLPLKKDDRKKAVVMIKATPEGSKLTGEQLADMLGVSRQTIQTYLAELRAAPTAKKRDKPDEEVARKKAFATLVRIETNVGLEVFHDFVEFLDTDKRAKLRAMLDGEPQ